MAVLQVQNIEKHFGKVQVLQDISFDLEEGQTLAIIGSSGSGKPPCCAALIFSKARMEERFRFVAKLYLMPMTRRRKKKRKSAKSGCILAWYSSPLTCFPSIRR